MAASNPSEPGSHQVPISEAMRLATEHHQAGRLTEAEAVYRAVLQAQPQHGGATYNLALVAMQQGRPKDALPVMRQTLDREPGRAAHWLNYAAALAGSGDAKSAREILVQARARRLGDEAISSLLAQVERMIKANSTAPSVIETVGDDGTPKASAPNLTPLQDLYRRGRYADVLAQSRDLWPSIPTSPKLAQVLGSSLIALNRFDTARALMARATTDIPDDALLHRLHGVALFRLGQRAEAQVAFERSLSIAADDMDTLAFASANAAARRDAVAARDYAARALALRPDHLDALRAMAQAAALGGAHEEAVTLYRRVIVQSPDAADVYVNLGFSLASCGRAVEAVRVLEHALKLRPDVPQAHSNLGTALLRLGDVTAAGAHYRRASDLAPERTDTLTAYLFCLLHDEAVAPQHCFEEHVRVGNLIEAPRRHLQRPHVNDRDPERALRIGFVSGDLRDHALAYLLEPIWRALQVGVHHLVAYSNSDREDAVTGRLRALVNVWRRVDELDDEALAAQIHDDRIDVLFDLSGHTTHNRLPVFAMKPAPVQVSWIGYPGTTGMASIDYRFVRGLPEEQGEAEGLFREKLVHLRHRLWQPEANAPPVAPLPAITRGHVTFGSFNRPGKISEATVDLWARVLAAVPGSTLMIAAASDEITRERLRSQFAARDVAAERLSFHPKLPLVEYLALHHEVDVALDTFPYAGSTTTSHALWMGVPVVTLAGDAPQQRAGAFILRRFGLDAWCTDSPQAYVEQACRAAGDLLALARLREQLRPLMATAYERSAEQAVREIDVALRSIWQRWCAGLDPASFTVDEAAAS